MYLLYWKGLSNVNTRNEKIDILRFVAIICIIFAHTAPVEFLFRIRNFDVTLMVLLLGISFYISSKDKEIHYLSYLRKRFERLIVPSWTFITVFLAIFFLISLIAQDPFYFSFKDIVTSYSMTSGIGYVWIMKVFFIVAVVSPFILKASLRIKSNTAYFLLLAACYTVYMLVILINSQLSGALHKIMEHVIEGFGYCLITSFGMRIIQLSKKEMMSYCLVFMTIFVSLLFYHNFASTQDFKYPPTLYYVSYGIFVSLLMYLLLDISKIKNFFTNKFVMYVSQSSLWLYFWHIIPIYLLKLFGSNLQIVSGNFITRFLFIIIVALILTYVQDKAKVAVSMFRGKKISTETV
jgi:peptidoglycan/LPS O-acetylase OafA/YrhL